MSNMLFQFKVFLFFLAFFLPSFAFGQEIIGQHDFYKEDGIVYSNATDEAYTGIVEYKFSKGEIQSQRVYENGLLHGVTNSWYVNGNASKSSTYWNGKLHGAFAAWHRNGQPSYQGEYKNGKQHGVWKRWDENGGLISEKTYDADKKRKFVLKAPVPPS